MLKRFTVENFSSFKNENIFDLTAGRTELNPSHIVDFKNTKVLKSAIVYGANASGKSNLIKAIDYAKNIITMGIDRLDTYKKYFRLDNESKAQPSSFEFEIEINGFFYSFGFSISIENRTIIEEWLYDIGKSSPEMIFERKNNEIILGKSLQSSTTKTRFNIYIDDMKKQKNKLFLSEVSNKKLDLKDATVFNEIFDWFDTKLLILYPNSKFGGIGTINDDNNLLQIYKTHLCQFDTGIVDFKSIEDDFDNVFKEFPSHIKETILSQMTKEKNPNSKAILNINGDLLTIFRDEKNDLKVCKLGILHNSSNNGSEVFELKDESDGTKRLFDLIPLIAKFPDNFTILIDEVDRSLHPKLTKDFFKLFYELNQGKTQLIVSTHESTLLDLNLVRRDEIWFIEKNQEGASSLYSLNQFKTRYDTKIDKAYLLGRYGAIPIFKSLQDIHNDEDEE